MKYTIGALQWKFPRAPLPFNPALNETVNSAVTVYLIDIEYESMWCQHTPLVESITPVVNACDLTPFKQTHVSAQEHNKLAASNRRPSIPCFRCTHQSFCQGTR